MDSYWSGLSAGLHDMLRREGRNVHGERGIFYAKLSIRSTAWQHDDDVFNRIMRGAKLIDRVALGPNRTWVIIFSDGDLCWSKCLPEKLFQALKKAKSGANRCTDIALGPDSTFSIKLADGSCEFSLSAEALTAIIGLIEKGNTLCNVFLGNGGNPGWLVRYK